MPSPERSSMSAALLLRRAHGWDTPWAGSARGPTTERKCMRSALAAWPSQTLKALQRTAAATGRTRDVRVHRGVEQLHAALLVLQRDAVLLVVAVGQEVHLGRRGGAGNNGWWQLLTHLMVSWWEHPGLRQEFQCKGGRVWGARVARAGAGGAFRSGGEARARGQDNTATSAALDTGPLSTGPAHLAQGVVESRVHQPALQQGVGDGAQRLLCRRGRRRLLLLCRGLRLLLRLPGAGRGGN